ncbi:hypothetical protein BDW02DRAFT_641606 [Decorospora gaudefroyi]|uniref:Uncharacterized protein n=1 Tax=Decorospora gaudefroyi TaxID=184978 RepID=A0A6A5K979_9PLEO|nr:hypothetical protein BDW02DRAFT_641606 [Decorospora gaudefroyi]
MSYQYGEQKRRSSSISIPHLPPPRPPPSATSQDRHRDARNAPSSTQQRYHSTGTTSLTTPSEPATRLPPSGSGKSRHAMATFTNLVDEARVSSPRKSDQGSLRNPDSYRAGGSTTLSGHSERSQRSAAAAQAQLERLDEMSARGRIEARSERNLFKATGQIPPTPTTGTEDDVYIRTEDLRSQCRAAGAEKQPDEPTKSPKKNFFSSIRNPFSKTTSKDAPPPISMPSKAAQVLGTSARELRTIRARPIKAARPVEQTPTNPYRSDTVKSLPTKVGHPESYAHRHYSHSRRRRPSGAGRGRRSPSRGSPSKHSDAENNPPVPNNNSSLESVMPPTPPAKDTPPDRRSMSPLRRVAPSQDLRDSYGAYKVDGANMWLPKFALSPLPSSHVLPGDGGASPMKFRPYTAEDYTKLVEGEALQWPYPEHTDTLSKTEAKRRMPLASAMPEKPQLQLRRPDRASEESRVSHWVSKDYELLQPRFYSPTHLSPRDFAEGETPSKNSDARRLLYTIPPESKSSLLVREESTEGSIRMIFQGDASEIDPNSPTGQEVRQHMQNMHNMQPVKTGEQRTDTALATRVMQELRIGEQYGTAPQNPGASGHLPLEQSSSRLTDMLDTVCPGRSDSHGEFQPNCPSAVPSPLHRVSGPLTSSSSTRSIIPSNGSVGRFARPLSPRNINDHFFMTNEHLDVVAKTTWDLFEVKSNQQLSKVDTKHDNTVELMEKLFEDVKSELSTVKDKVESTANGQHKVCAVLDSISDVLKENISQALAQQDKKMTSMEAEIKELKQMVQKLAETKAVQPHSATGQANTPNTAHSPYPPSSNPRSQHSLNGYYPTTEGGRDGQLPMAQDGHNDARAGYQNGYSQHWAARSAYSSRNKDDRAPYSSTNPYHFASAAGGQYNNGYAGNSYSSFNFSPSSPDQQQYPFNHGQAK